MGPTVGGPADESLSSGGFTNTWGFGFSAEGLGLVLLESWWNWSRTCAKTHGNVTDCTWKERTLEAFVQLLHRKLKVLHKRMCEQSLPQPHTTQRKPVALKQLVGIAAALTNPWGTSGPQLLQRSG